LIKKDIKIYPNNSLDDNYETNNFSYDAYDISSNEFTWLSDINGTGIQYDDDWYEIFVNPGVERILVNLTFNHTEGNINIDIYDSSITLLTKNNSDTDNEYIDYELPSSGIYYLLIYGDDAGNEYDLWWDDIASQSSFDDNYEENDAYTSAYNLTSYEDRWLSTIDGFGIQADNDWYEIYIEPGYQHLKVEVVFLHDYGDIDIEVYNISLYPVASSWFPYDNESINIILKTSGTYYLKLYYGDDGNKYDLWWNATIGVPSMDDMYEENDDYGSAYNLIPYEDRWLSTVDGQGILGDYDWYEISVNSEYLRLLVNVTFAYAEGNIDLHIYDQSNIWIVYNRSKNTYVYLDFIFLFPGTYYILIFGASTYNSYDLWWNATITPSDDKYEDNDSPGTAYNISSNVQNWLSSLKGRGIQSDDDWYEIYIEPGYEFLWAFIGFSHSEGDIDMELYNASLNLVHYSRSTTNDEMIFNSLPSAGVYYLKIYGENAGNVYDLWWSDFLVAVPNDDQYEENDDIAISYDLSVHEKRMLYLIDGYGIQLDDDWYAMYVDPGYEHLYVWIAFAHADGDIGINVYDSSFNLMANNNSNTDNEYIDIIVPSTGYYYLEVYGDDVGNQYSFYWCDLSVADDTYEENDVNASAYDLSDHKDIWLNSIDGNGFQFDDDWYKVYIDPEYDILMVYITYNTHYLDYLLLDVTLYDSEGTALANSISGLDNQQISSWISTSGYYYVLVSGSNVGNEYDLKWFCYPYVYPDDFYEENDVYYSAYNLSADSVGLGGYQYDQDWYKFSLVKGYINVTIDLVFSHVDGNINLALYDSMLNLIANSTSTTDNEHIDYILVPKGTYYIKVYGDNSGNSYLLYLTKYQHVPPDEPDVPSQEGIPGFNLFFLFGIVVIISILLKKDIAKNRLNLKR
jgi:hypothetical protein